MLNQNSFKKNILHYNPNKIIVGYSGGVDSHVLLHLTKVAFQNSKIKVKAIHINHKLQNQADDWESHCSSICKKLEIPIIVEQIKSKPNKGDSLEAYARKERYKLIKKHIKKNTIFISGHHQSDQAETFLLQLMRGAGIDGLSCMPKSKKFAKGLYVRPLLDVEKLNIIEYADNNNLHYINDPSNKNTQFARNFIRQEIIPKLQTYWPKSESSIVKSTKWISEAKHVRKQTKQNKLIITKLSKKELTLQKQIIRDFFKYKVNTVISQNQLDYILNNLIKANADKNPELLINNYIIRRFNNQIIITLPCPALSEDNITTGNNYKIKGLGKIKWSINEGIDKSIFNELIVKPVNTKHRFHPHNRNHSQTIKKLFLEYKIPYWLRQSTPGFYYRDELIAIANIGISKAFYTNNKNSMMPVWKIKQKFVKI